MTLKNKSLFCTGLHVLCFLPKVMSFCVLALDTSSLSDLYTCDLASLEIRKLPFTTL